MTKTLLQGLFHFHLAFIEQSIMRKRQIPRIPMGFARDRVGEYEVEDELSRNVLNAFAVQRLHKHIEVVGLQHGV